MRGCYLLHFDRPYGHARHYTGWASDVEARIEAHRRGQGARLMEVVAGAGIGFTVARLWPDADRHQERRLKRSGGASRYCPLCKAAARERAVEAAERYALLPSYDPLRGYPVQGGP